MKKNTGIIASQFIKKAVYFASEKHDGQYRKGTKVPYFAHAVLVAFGVLKHSHDEQIIAAAVLHDVLEDCPNVKKNEIKKLFGSKVSRMVEEVSAPIYDNKKGKTWKDKKQTYIKKIKEASKASLVIVASDKITNMQGYFDAVQSRGIDVVSKFFSGSLEDYFWYYNEVLIILQSNIGKHPIVKEYKKILKQYESTLLT